MVGGRDEVVDARLDPGDEGVLVHVAGKVAVDESLQVFLRGLFDRRVVREAVVVLGEPLVDVDGEPERVGHRLRGLHRTPLRAAHQPRDGESGQRVGQSLGLLDAVLGQVGIRTLPGFAAQRQRMSDE